MVQATFNYRLMGSGWKQAMAPPEVGAALKDLTIKQHVCIAINICKSLEELEN